MKLRNKKTGKIYDKVNIHVTPWKIGTRGWTALDYNSVDKFNEEWEDYNPKEPLIKDEKIRRCVKLWTELNGYGKSLMYAEGDDWSDEWCSFYEPLDDEELLFHKHRCANLQNRKIYTIDELCGKGKNERAKV